MRPEATKKPCEAQRVGCTACLHVHAQVKPRVFKPGRPIVVSGQEYMRKLGRHQRLLLPQQGSGQEAAGQPESDWLY